MNDKPFAPACERNQQAILEAITPFLQNTKHVLEIGSGTGQHAIFFASHLPHINWQTSDVVANHPGIMAWIKSASVKNVLKPLTFDVNENILPAAEYDVVFTANTFHIMSWTEVVKCLEKASQALKNGGLLIVYGPFIFSDIETAPSNMAFDAQLKKQKCTMGLRTFADLQSVCKRNRLMFSKKIIMPANNFILAFKKL